MRETEINNNSWNYLHLAPHHKNQIQFNQAIV